ncbi:MerR family transcriptional regulator [Flavisolibacter nicotianae]|uniref:MerR family transcriptional regulator n=1 Tax=Flavisolibacter nicotianae TaxID=2364882 RepID=UPI000EAE127B|nr:MerR family transcriptional regulator [Flavisolibacter nicotianae]
MQKVPKIDLPDPDEKVVEIAWILTQKDYTSEALAYINNHSRTLNYWSEGEESLLPEENPGHHRFSFHDLVWLGLVKEFRDLGVSKRQLFKLKQDLLAKTDAEFLYQKLQENRSAMEAVLLQSGVAPDGVKALIDFTLQNKRSFTEYQATYLLSLINSALYLKRSLFVLLNKEGEMHLLLENEFKNGLQNDQEFLDFFKSPHLSVHLNSVIGFFLSKDYIQDSLKEAVFSKDEWKIIQTIRNEKPDAITVKFSGDGHVEHMEVTKKKKVQLEARLSEIIAAGSYETITIVTQNGKPVSVKKQKKIK